VYALIDAITGSVYDTGLPNPNDVYSCRMSYQRDSDLFVLESSATPEGGCKPRFYRWTGSKFETLPPEGFSDVSPN